MVICTKKESGAEMQRVCLNLDELQDCIPKCKPRTGSAKERRLAYLSLSKPISARRGKL
jgi:hypothetical protein